MGKRIALCVLLAGIGLPGSAQVRMSADFDTGSLGSYRRVDSVWIHRSAADSLLTLAYEVETRSDPSNPVDSLIPPSSRWYHFRMEGVKDRQIVLRIAGSEVVRPFYSYDGITYRRFDAGENALPGTLTKIFMRDTVYVAYYEPYGNGRHRRKAEQWAALPYVRKEVIGQSTGGRPIEMLTVTDPDVPDAGKKRVWMHSRVHTSEAPASCHLEGLVDELLSDSPFARELRRHAVFHIVPQTNPDAVYGGYSRSTSTGVNLEVNWNRPDSLTEPEVRALKRTIERLTSDRPFDLVLNLHSQISPSLTYWIHTAASTSPAMHARKMLLSALTVCHSPYYRPQDQCFSTIAPKYPEGWLWNRFGERTLAVTFETTYSYFNHDPEGTWVSAESLRELARSSLLAVSDLLDLGGSVRMISDAEHMRRSGKWTAVSGNDSLHFGGSYLVAGRAGASVRASFPQAEPGTYAVYKWIVGPVSSDYSSEVNTWKRIGTVHRRKAGRLRFRYRAPQARDTVDALLFVRE